MIDDKSTEAMKEDDAERASEQAASSTTRQSERDTQSCSSLWLELVADTDDALCTLQVYNIWK